MRVKITILFVFAFHFSMLSIFIKNDYSPLNMLWLRIVYSVCALLLVFVLILNYKKLSLISIIFYPIIAFNGLKNRQSRI
jgi:hypothetical protein